MAKQIIKLSSLERHWRLLCRAVLCCRAELDRSVVKRVAVEGLPTAMGVQRSANNAARQWVDFASRRCSFLRCAIGSFFHGDNVCLQSLNAIPTNGRTDTTDIFFWTSI